MGLFPLCPCHWSAIGTFEGPFTVASNGYFSAWIAFYASLKYAYSTSDQVRDFTDRAVNAMKVLANPLPVPFSCIFLQVLCGGDAGHLEPHRM